MKYAALTAMALCLSACTTTPQLKSDVILPSQFHDGWVYVLVSINGAPPVWMDIDNGTTPSAIDLDYAQSIGLKLKSGKGSGTGIGTQRIDFFNTSADIEAGGYTRHIDFVATPLHGMRGPDGQPLAGVLGFSFLEDRIVVIDYRTSALRFVASSPPCSCDLAMKLDTDIPTVPITVAGHKLTALIDSGGAYDLFLTPAAVETAGLQDWADKATPSTGYGYAGAQDVRNGMAPDVSVGSVSKTNPAAVYGTFGTSPLKAQAALGNQFLKAYRVTLNYRAHTVRIEP